MSIRIIKSGISDAFFDEGRFGYQHIGINPTGAMDNIAVKIVNALTLNHSNEAALEMHFPAATISFKKDALIALSGADFTATINHSIVPVNKPILVKQNAILQFKKPLRGARVYLGVQGGFKLSAWLESYSTNTMVNAGGYFGRRLKTGDEIHFKGDHSYPDLSTTNAVQIFPFQANINELYQQGSIRIVAGRHFKLLTTEAQQQLLQQAFTITGESNRMGYKLQSQPLALQQEQNIISSAVTKGTIQLLPNGQLIVLMADHQTTGGYPIIVHVITADVCTLAQYNQKDSIHFKLVSNKEAEEAFLSQHRHLLQLQNACNLRLNDFINTYNRP
ncbi:MAG: biotin-dependent carboxyltransferase family protein [Chitinophagaceae bacterium]|nr:biotin-dependent carboxyltransferase family protein [Chitinophagaceae bacterium]